MTPGQCRAARSLLKWTQDDLAAKAEVSVITVRSFEGEKSQPRRVTLASMQRVLESAGVEFIPGGARLREAADAQL
jgi:DNA-binding XRE family transcriptional regulator